MKPEQDVGASRMTPDEYRRLVLASADADGKLSPPPLTDWWLEQRLLLRMYWEGLIEKRGKGPMWNRGGPWYVARGIGVRSTETEGLGPEGGEPGRLQATRPEGGAHPEGVAGA